MRIIRGEYGRRRFDVPTKITARPTTDFARENIFNVIENLVNLEGITAVDLFAGTGAISFELLSRGAASVTAVEQASLQGRFIADVARKLGCDDRLRLVRGDAFRYVASASMARGLVFADPPYDLPRFDEVARDVLASPLMGPGTIFVLEHGKNRSYESHPWFLERRTYGSVNFSIFRRPEAGEEEVRGVTSE